MAAGTSAYALPLKVKIKLLIKTAARKAYLAGGGFYAVFYFTTTAFA